MNLFLREMKASRKSLFLWCLLIIIFIAASMAKFGGLSSSAQATNELLASMPQAFKDVFGMGGFNLSTAIGFFGVIYYYLLLAVAIHSITIGSNIFTKEENDKTAEFLFAKPISRDSVIKAKIFAALANTFILNLFISACSILFVSFAEKSSASTGYVITMMISMYLLQLLFLFAGTTVAALIRRPKSAAPITSAIILGTFFISILIDLNKNLSFLKFATPFKYFEAKDIIAGKGINLSFALLTLLLIAGFIVVTFVFYKKRDLKI